MSKRSKHKLNLLRKRPEPAVLSDREGNTQRVDLHMKEADQALAKVGEANVMELSRMIRENPSLANALTRQEKAALFAADQPVSEELALDYNVKAAEAEAQGHVCSICGIQFEGIGHNAAPFPGRCCKACSDDRVIPMRKKRFKNGMDPRHETAAKEFRTSHPRAGMNEWAKPTPTSELALDPIGVDPSRPVKDRWETVAEAREKPGDWERRAGIEPGDTFALTGAAAEEVMRMHPGLKTGDEVVLEKGPNWDRREELVNVSTRHADLDTAREAMARSLPGVPVKIPVNIVPNEARIDRTPQTGAGKSPAFTKRIRPEGETRLWSMAALVKQNLIPDIPTTLERMMAEHFPEVLRKFYPRIYENVGRYHSPRQCAAFLANMTAETEALGYHRAPTAYRLMLPALEPMAQRGMPMFFIAPDLLKAIQLTDFADDIDWTTLRLPFEQGIFILPKGALTHHEDGDVAMIVWARYRKGIDYPAPIRGWEPTSIGNDAFVIVGLCIQNGIWYDSTFNADHRPTLRLHNMFYREAGESTPKSQKMTNLDADLTDYDEGFLEKLGVIAFGTFLAMNAKPELVEKGKLLKRVTKANEKPKEFWSPNIIGPKYRLKREVPRLNRYGKFAADQPKRDLGGTHASPRFHWRRGHWRNQAFGKGYKEHKQLWIEPVAIGLGDAAEGAEA